MAINPVNLNIDPQGYAGGIVQPLNVGPMQPMGGYQFGDLMNRIMGGQDKLAEAQLAGLRQKMNFAELERRRQQEQYEQSKIDRMKAEQLQRQELGRQHARETPTWDVSYGSPFSAQIIGETKGPKFTPTGYSRMGTPIEGMRPAASYFAPSPDEGRGRGGMVPRSSMATTAAVESPYSSYEGPMSSRAMGYHPGLTEGRQDVGRRSNYGIRKGFQGRVFTNEDLSRKLGGYVPETRKYLLHKGEVVVPAPTVKQHAATAAIQMFPDRKLEYQQGTAGADQSWLDVLRNYNPDAYQTIPSAEGAYPSPYEQPGGEAGLGGMLEGLGDPLTELPIEVARRGYEMGRGAAGAVGAGTLGSIGRSVLGALTGQPTAGFPGGSQSAAAPPSQFPMMGPPKPGAPRTPVGPAGPTMHTVTGKFDELYQDREDEARKAKVRSLEEDARMKEVEAEEIYRTLDMRGHQLSPETYKQLNVSAGRKMAIADRYRKIAESHQGALDVTRRREQALTDAFAKMQHASDLTERRTLRTKAIQEQLMDARVKGREIQSIRDSAAKAVAAGKLDADDAAEYIQEALNLIQTQKFGTGHEPVTKEFAKELMNNPAAAGQLDQILQSAGQ